jgi:ribosomal-protein-alanine N-acetyltransferase
MDSVETQRFLLRPLTQDDLLSLHAVVGEDPEMTWETKPWSLERTEDRLRLRLKHYQEHGFGVWAVVEKVTGELIGQAGLQFLENTDLVELVAFTAKRRWSDGVALEACTAALGYGFRELRLTRIIAVIRPGNVAAQKLASNLGFRFVLRGLAYGIEACYYELLASEFAPKDDQYKVSDAVEARRSPSIEP